ncbi:MAG TPA: ABC transporter substrate-binding protein [Polyangiaceae bacterium]|nr:ABC transporter substrate-binding protein [Polyangiaceae bacterium]
MRLERRKILAALALSAGLLGCSKHSGEASARESSAPLKAQPRVGGELVFAFDGAANTQFALDPHKSAFAPHARIIRSIFDSLVVLLPGHRFGPWLAKSWEISGDGLSYTFHLRSDVKFHDGTRFDAAAVKYNLDRIKEPKNAFYSLSDIGSYQSSKVIDEFTVQVQFSRPYAAFLANLSKPSLGIVSPAAAEKYGETFALNPVGTGPFKFKSLTPGTEIALERNPDYQWAPEGAAHAGPAWLEHLTFKNVPEEATRVAVLENGQAGAVDLIPPQNLVQLRSSPKFHLVERELLNHNYSLYLNINRAPWSDARVREAFKLSLDIDTAVKTIYLGTAARAWAPLSPSILGYDKSLEGSWKPDRAAANRILDELGWKPGSDGIRIKDGQRLAISFLDTQGNREKRLDLITVFRRQLRDTGFELRVDNVPMGSYLEKATSGSFDLVAGSLFAPDPDVLRRIYAADKTSLLAIFKGTDPELTRLLVAGSEALQSDERVKVYGQAQRLILEKTYAIPTYVLVYSVAAANQVQGLAIDTHGFPVFNDAWLR